MVERRFLADDEARIRCWVRAIWRLPDGHRITRTVRREVPGDPEDEERALVVLHELLEELRAAGYEFPEGHGMLEQVLGATTG